MPVCLFPQLEEVPVPYCRPHNQGLTQKELPQPSYQLVSAILDKSKESSRQNEVFHSFTTMDPARATSLEPQWLEQGKIDCWGQITPFSGREERTRSLGRDTRRRAMSQARASTGWVFPSPPFFP